MKVISRFFLGPGTFITYPHTNAFVHGGRALAYVQKEDAALHLCLLDLATQGVMHRERIGTCSEVGQIVWTDVALEAGRVAAVFKNSAWILDLDRPRGWVRVYQAEAPARLDGLCSLSRKGTRLLCSEGTKEARRAIEIDLPGGKVRELFSKDWYANHFHYCPHDESWVAFSHEGPAEQIGDRCWVWQAEKAPAGRIAFDQVSEKPGTLLCVGHERWGFHDISAYVPAYAVSPAGKRGLYEIFGDGRPARLLWENDVLWHCGMDLTGRFVVVDTTGPFREGKMEEGEYREALDRHLKTDREKGRNASDVVLIDLRTRRALPVATVERAQHPYHPHPAISPDLRWVIWNDSSNRNQGAWLAAISMEAGEATPALRP